MAEPSELRNLLAETVTASETAAEPPEREKPAQVTDVRKSRKTRQVSAHAARTASSCRATLRRRTKVAKSRPSPKRKQAKNPSRRNR